MTDQASTTNQASTTGQASRGERARRSRRQLLTRGAGTLAAVFAAEALARPAPTHAGTDGDVVLGSFNQTPGITEIRCTSPGKAALLVFSAGTNEAGGVAVAGTILDNATSAGKGVSGGAFFGAGVHGSTGGGIGVHGESVGMNNVNTGIGVLGEAEAGPGVKGISQSGPGVVGQTGTGTGVQGTSVTGSGVAGSSSKGQGVFGLGASASAGAVAGLNLGVGPGVKGASPAGIGVLASGKTALSVQGAAAFSRSGILTVAAGQSSAKKTGIALERASLVLATIQGNQAGVHVQGVTMVTGSSGSFTIHLNKTVSKSINVAWFAVN